jgi:PPOX class probable F420-dependent enzyme
LKTEEKRYLLTKKRGFLATVNDYGTPTLVPVCFAYDDGVLYTGVDAKPKTSRLARISNVKRRPEVAFIVDTYSDDWMGLSYLLIHGKAALVTSLRERRHAVRLLTKKYPQYRWLGKEMKAIVKITVKRTKFWKFKKRLQT